MKKILGFLFLVMLVPSICLAALTPTAEFTFDGHCGNLVNGEVGKQFGNVKYGKGFLNDAVYLDGDGDYIDYGKGYNLGKNFTFNVWIKPDKENLQREDAAIFCKYESNGYGPYDFYISNNRPAYWVSTGKGKDSYQEHVSKTKLNPDTWYMLTYTYDYGKQQLSIYINGNLDSSFQCVPVIQNDDKVTVGRQALMFQPYSNLQYKGWIDEMQIYDGTLSNEDVKNLYNRYVSLSELIIVPIENTPVSNQPIAEEMPNSARIFHLNPGYRQGDHYNEEGGLFITNMNVKENLNDENPVTFDVYNTKDAVGIVEYYDENGKFIRADKIAPQTAVIKDIYSFVEIWKRTFGKIEFTKLEAPKGTRTIIVTNNQTKSLYLLMHNVVDHIFKEIKLVKNLNALLKSYDAFDENSTSEKVINDVKEKWTERIIHTLQENYKNRVNSGEFSKSEFEYKIGSDLTMKLGEQELKNDVLQHFDLQKALEETTEYVIKNSGKIALEEVRSISTKIVDGLLNGNPAIIGFKSIDFIGNSLDTLSKFMTEKQLENAKPMIFYIENLSESNIVPDIFTNETEMLKKLVGTYKGSYSQSSGESGMTLNVFQDTDGTFMATWDFYNLPGKNNTKHGMTKCKVSYDVSTKSYTIQSYEWINKPEGYIFMTLTGQLNGDILSGNSPAKFSISRVTNEVNKKIPSDSFTYNGHRYYIYSKVAGVNTWEDAKKYCEKLGGHLAVINDKAENDALYDYITSRGHKTAYFGLSDSAGEGKWKWLDDSVTYYNWFNGEPNGGRGENYAEFYYKFTDGRWNDGNFGHGTQNDSKTFICEWDS